MWRAGAYRKDDAGTGHTQARGKCVVCVFKNNSSFLICAATTTGRAKNIVGEEVTTRSGIVAWSGYGTVDHRQQVLGVAQKSPCFSKAPPAGLVEDDRQTATEHVGPRSLRMRKHVGEQRWNTYVSKAHDNGTTWLKRSILACKHQTTWTWTCVGDSKVERTVCGKCRYYGCEDILQPCASVARGARSFGHAKLGNVCGRCVETGHQHLSADSWKASAHHMDDQCIFVLYAD